MIRIKQRPVVIELHDEVKVADDIAVCTVIDIRDGTVIILNEGVKIAAVVLGYSLLLQLPALVDREIAAILFHVMYRADDVVIIIRRRFGVKVLLYAEQDADLSGIFLPERAHVGLVRLRPGR